MTIAHRFTLLIPTRNRPERAFELLCYVRKQLGWKIPILVADQSDDCGARLAELLEQSALQGIGHFVDNRRGANSGRNETARRAHTDWLLLLDDDVRPAAGYLERLEEFLEANPWVDVVQCATEQREAWREYLNGDWRPSNDGRRRSCPPDWSGIQWFTSSPWAGYEALPIGLGAGNMAISREAYLNSGGFDERICGPGEDREFGLRLWWLGYRCCLCPGAVAFHLHEPLGGRREVRSRIRALFNPEPSPSWIYFHLKWFPGRPSMELIVSYVLKFAREPWKLPVKCLRLWRSVRAARKLLAAGPLYCSVPAPRASTRPHVTFR